MTSFDCPSCRSPMARGFLELRGSGAVAGMNLWWFVEGDERDRELALQFGEDAPAHLCRKCGTLVVPPERG